MTTPNVVTGAIVRPDPTVAMLMGDVKRGKTLDAIYAYPQALFIAAQGALKAAAMVGGINIPPNRIRNPITVRDAIAHLNNPPAGTTALIVDDLTLLVDATVRAYESAGVGKWTLWRTIRNDLMDLRTNARKMKLPVVFTLHDKPPRYEEAGRAEGGAMMRILIEAGAPALPGQMAKGMPAVCDAILLARKSTALVSMWPVVYENLPLDPTIEGVGLREMPPISPMPMNLAEILRCAGHLVPAPFPEHEENVAKLSAIFVEHADSMKALAEASVAKFDAKFAAQGARAWVRRNWVIRDALARAQLKIAVDRFRAKPPFYGTGSSGDEV